MAAKAQSIRPLPPESQAKIRSSVIITSLNDVIVGLLENALDACATSVEIRLDYVKGYCSVSDDGVGIPEEEFALEGHLGSLHYTSKLDPKVPTYGRYGRFLYYLASLSLLSIASRQASNACSLTLHRARVVARSMQDTGQMGAIPRKHGSQVVVGNLFGDIPVRYRHIALHLENANAVETEFSTLKRLITSLLLACGRPIEVKLTETRAKKTYRHKALPAKEQVEDSLKQQTCSFHPGKICSTIHQAGYLDRLDFGSWKPASVQTTSIRIRAATSIIPSPSKDVQFISIGHRPLATSISASLFLDDINTIFDNSSFGGMLEYDDLSDMDREWRGKNGRFAPDRHTSRQLGGRKKGVDRWPMFYVRIELKDAEDLTMVDGASTETVSTGNLIAKILELLRSLFHEFLTVHCFQPRARRKRRTEMASLNMTASGDSILESSEIAELPMRPYLTARAASESGLTPKNFDAWSRVKSGTSNPTARPMKALSSMNPETSLVEHDSARPQSQQTKIELAQNALGDLELQALDDLAVEALLESVQVDEIGDHVVKCAPEHAGSTRADSDGTSVDDPDEAVYLWTNPTTGIEHKINARNGHIVPQAKHHVRDTASDTNIATLDRPASAPAETTIVSRIRPRPPKRSPAELIASLQQSKLIRSFRPMEERIPSVIPDELDDTGNVSTGQDCPHRHLQTSEYFSTPANITAHSLSRSDLEKAEVVSQVDQKFVLIQTQPQGMLVLVDQHAADERVMVEDLYRQLCAGETTTLAKPIIFEVPQRELELFIRHQARFAEWQICYDVGQRRAEVTQVQIAVRSLPALISERCRLDPKLLINLLRREIHAPTTSPCHPPAIGSTQWIHRIPHCPKGIVELLNSRACRSAIMFNDVLDRGQCEELVRRLVQCTLPFQCAHGRPSCVALPGWQTQTWEGIGRKGSFAQAFERWEDV